MKIRKWKVTDTLTKKNTHTHLWSDCCWFVPNWPCVVFPLTDASANVFFFLLYGRHRPDRNDLSNYGSALMETAAGYRITYLYLLLVGITTQSLCWEPEELISSGWNQNQISFFFGMFTHSRNFTLVLHSLTVHEKVNRHRFEWEL